MKNQQQENIEISNLKPVCQKKKFKRILNTWKPNI